MAEKNFNVWTFASMLGVGVIGFGLGSAFAGYFRQYAALIVLAGIIMHGAAMYVLHNQGKKESTLAIILYWLCWIILAGLLVYVLGFMQ